MSKNALLALGILSWAIANFLSAVWLPDVHAGTQSVAEIWKRIDKDSHLVALIPCEFTSHKEAICVVTEKNNTSGVNEPTRVLRIYDTGSESVRQIFQYDSYNGLFSLRAISVGAGIAAVWETGSAVEVTLFREIDKEIRLVLDVGTKFSPEIIDLDGDWEKEVVISHSEKIVPDKQGRSIITPTKASIYKFQNGKYTKVKEVQWKERLRSLP